MVTIQELFHDEKHALSKLLAADQSVRASVQVAQNCFDRMKQDYIAKQNDPKLRQEAVGLFGVARRTLSTCEAVQKTRLFQDIPTAPRTTYALRQIRWPEAMLLALPPVLCAVVCLMLLVTSSATHWIIVSIGATVGAIYQAFRLWSRPEKYKEVSQSEVKAQILVHPPALLTTMELICSEMDNQLRQSAQRVGIKPQKLFWTKGQLAEIQILWEALQNKDGAYALSAVPSILNELEKQGVHIKRYCPETAKYFDAIPAESDGITVRPAFLSDETVLARGRVTAAMLKSNPSHAE